MALVDLGMCNIDVNSWGTLMWKINNGKVMLHGYYCPDHRIQKS